MKSILEYDGKNIFDFLKGNITLKNTECKIKIVDKITKLNKNKYTVVLCHKMNYDIYRILGNPHGINLLSYNSANFYNDSVFDNNYCVKNLRYSIEKNTKNVDEVTDFFKKIRQLEKNINNLNKILKQKRMFINDIYDFFESTELYCFLRHLNPIMNPDNNNYHPFTLNYNVNFHFLSKDEIDNKDFIKNNKMYFHFDSKDKALHFANFFREFSKFFHVLNVYIPLTEYLDNSILEKLNNRKYNIKVINRVQYNYKISIDVFKIVDDNFNINNIIDNIDKNNIINIKYKKVYNGKEDISYPFSLTFNSNELLTYLIMVLNNYIKDITLYTLKNHS